MPLSRVSAALLCLAAAPAVIAASRIAVSGRRSTVPTREVYYVVMLAAPRLLLVGVLLAWMLARGGLTWAADAGAARWAVAPGAYLVAEVVCLGCFVWAAEPPFGPPHALLVAVRFAAVLAPLVLLGLLAVDAVAGGRGAAAPGWLPAAAARVLGAVAALGGAVWLANAWARR